MVTKAQKKFGKKGLKDNVKKRKDSNKLRGKIRVAKEAQEEKRTRKAEQQEEEERNGSAPDKNGSKFADMSVDDFFQGGFDIPEALQTKAEKKRGTVPQPSPQTGKRKRTPIVEADSDSDSDTSQPSQAEPMDEVSEDEIDSASDSDDDPEAHQAQLKALAEKDPEFYKYLKENDAELLDFDEARFGELKELNGEAPSKRRKTEDASDEEEAGDTSELTMAQLSRWEDALIKQHSLRAAREVVIAFRAASHLNEEGQTFKYTVSNSDVYNKVLNLSLRHVPEVLEHHLPVKTNKSGKVSVPTDPKKLKTVTPMLKTYVNSISHLLENLSDNNTLRLTLTSILPILPYILSFKKAVKDLTKIVVNVWSESSSDEATRIAAFLVLRRLVSIADAGIREGVLRATYQGLINGARNTTPHTIQGINLMKNSAAELWAIDPSVGYTTGFTFIRQLAIHLRTSITNKSKESYKAVYNWQYVHSLDFWSRVLSQSCASLREAEQGRESPLRPLIYPLVQVTMGVMRLIPTAQYFPLRFQLIRALLRISLTTSTFIPVAPALYEVLSSREMKKPPKSTTLKALDFETSIRAAKSYLRTRIYQDGLGEQVSELLSEFFVLWSKSIAFPELALPVVVMLKRWLKESSHRQSGNKNSKVNQMIVLLIQKLDANSKWIEERRARIDFAPNNRAGVDTFLKEESWEKTPLGAFVVTQRKLREERQKILEKGRKDEEIRRAKDRKEEGERPMDEGAFSAEEESEDEIDLEEEEEEEEEDDE